MGRSNALVQSLHCNLDVLLETCLMRKGRPLCAEPAKIVNGVDFTAQTVSYRFGLMRTSSNRLALFQSVRSTIYIFVGYGLEFSLCKQKISDRHGGWEITAPLCLLRTSTQQRRNNAGAVDAIIDVILLLSSKCLP